MGFQHAKGLFDAPAQPVQPHQFYRFIWCLRRQRAEQPPMQRFKPRLGINLARIHQRELNAFGIARAPRVAWVTQPHPAGPHNNGCLAASVAWPARRHLYCISRQNRPGIRHVKKHHAIAKRAVLGGAHQQMHGLWTPAEQRVDIAFSVADHDNLRGCREPATRGLGGSQPTLRLLVFERAGASVRGRRCLARPDLGFDKAQHCVLIGIDSHGCVDEEARRGLACRIAVAGGSQPARLAAGEINFCGVLGDDDPPPSHRRYRPVGQAFERRRRRHMRAGQHTVGGELAPAVDPDLANDQGVLVHNFVKQARHCRRPALVAIRAHEVTHLAASKKGGHRRITPHRVAPRKKCANAVATKGEGEQHP